MRRLACLLAGFAGFSLLAVAVDLPGSEAGPFSLEQALSAPFPSDLVAAPAGGAVAWVFDARGTRNVWAAEPPAYRGRPLTAYSDDERASDVFAAGVDFHGVHDWNVVIANFESTYDPAKNAALARLAFESSPLSSVATWRSPVLLIHGDDDRNVPFSETVDLAQALRARGVEVEQLVFPDEVHDFLRHQDWLRAFRAPGEFLERRLAGTAGR